MHDQALTRLAKQIRRKIDRCRSYHLPCMSFEELLELALTSKHWKHIGSNRGQYHFCRRDHTKGYITQNVFIGLGSENIAEALTRRRATPKTPLSRHDNTTHAPLPLARHHVRKAAHALNRAAFGIQSDEVDRDV